MATHDNIFQVVYYPIKIDLSIWFLTDFFLCLGG